MKFLLIFLLSIGLTMLITAGGGSDDSAPDGDAELDPEERQYRKWRAKNPAVGFDGNDPELIEVLRRQYSETLKAMTVAAGQPFKPESFGFSKRDVERLHEAVGRVASASKETDTLVQGALNTLKD